MPIQRCAFCNNQTLRNKMCTVSYLPLKDANYILTSNRDESPKRPNALPINQYCIGDKTVYFPKDPQAGGTWIATTGDDRTICLLNGAFQPHVQQAGQTFSKSRGIVVLDYFRYAGLLDYTEQYDFDQVEPFTLIVLETINSQTQLTELRWDGELLHSTAMDETIPHIWSSVTLYSPEIRLQRTNWFDQWINEHAAFAQDNVMDFHRFAGEGDQTSDLIMQKGNRQTVSICSIQRNEGLTTAVYVDLLKEETSNYVVYHAC